MRNRRSFLRPKSEKIVITQSIYQFLAGLVFKSVSDVIILCEILKIWLSASAAALPRKKRRKLFRAFNNSIPAMAFRAEEKE
jgi:hypothetical protein